MTQSNGSVSFVLGELVVQTQTDANGNTISSGFSAQSTTITTVSEPNKEVLSVNVYPNPTSDLLYVDVLNTQLNWVYIDIVDLQGKQISSEKYAGMSNHIGINTSSYTAGTYTLLLKDENANVLGSYKLIKQ